MAALGKALAESHNHIVIDRSMWLTHWRVWSLAMTCVGGAIATAGAAIAAQRQWGLLLLAVVLLFAAIAPWVVEAIGLVRYPYERAGSVETFVLLAFSLLAAWGYFMRSGSRTDA
jgi:hypothetical protein